MPVIQTLLPQKLPSQRVQREPSGSFREDDFVESNHALQNQRIGFLLHGRGFPEMQSTGGVSGSVQILGPRIAEIDRLWINNGAVPWFRFVVNDCGVGSGGGNRVKGQADEVFVFSM